MAKIVSKNNIPKSGDIVLDVKYNEARTLACIIFKSGKKVIFHIAEEQTPIGTKVPDHMKNTPEDPDYKNRALEALKRMDESSNRSPVEVVSESSKAQQLSLHQQQYQQLVGGADPLFKEKAQKALEQSAKRAEQFSRKE
jgi:hypothetical protein